MAFRTLEITNPADIHIKNHQLEITQEKFAYCYGDSVWKEYSIVHQNTGNSIRLSKAERYELAHGLHNACMIQKQKSTILSAISVMCESLKQCYLENDISLLELPTVLPIESLELVNE